MSQYTPATRLRIESNHSWFLSSVSFKHLEKLPMTTGVALPNDSAGKQLTARLVAFLADVSITAFENYGVNYQCEEVFQTSIFEV